jgi:uncharacterized protein (TIGR03435 family)
MTPAIVERLGSTLLHFLWQGLAIGILYAAARATLARTWSPNARYLLACATLIAMCAAPIATWMWLSPSPGGPDSAYRIAGSGTTADGAAVSEMLSVMLPGESRLHLSQWVVAIWLAGAMIFSLRLANAWMRVQRLRSVAMRSAPTEWQKALDRMRDSRPVQLLASSLVQTPAVIGWLRPVILIPTGALAGLAPQQMEALLAHELAHIRRHDYLVNLMQTAVEALLFYHPAVWWVSAQVRAERERCCDDAAVAASGDVLTYVNALAELEARRPAHLAAAVAASGDSLVNRIARLLGQSQAPAHAASRSGIAALAILVSIAAYGLFAQSAKPAFQAASVKANTTNPPRRIVRPQAGGRLMAENAPLMMLIQNAYRVQMFQVVGGPDWINTDGFDLEAKPESSATRDEMWRMLQALLADRFKLTMHREKRDLPAYLLTAAKGGVKQLLSSGCTDPAPDQSLPSTPAAVRSPLCGNVSVTMSAEGLTMQGDKVQPAELVRMLADVLGRPVLDRTEISGVFNVQIKFARDDATQGLPRNLGPVSLTPGEADPNRPSIFAAIQEQMGLKLQSGKGPVDVLVIDHVERPSAN